MNSRHLLLSVLTLVATAYTAFACRCMQPGELTAKMYNEIDLVIVGKAVRVEHDEKNMLNIITFEVSNGVKMLEKTKTVRITTADNGAACGLGIAQGDEWYIWASKDDAGNFMTNSCMRSQQLTNEGSPTGNTERYNADLKYISTLKDAKGTQKFRSTSDLGYSEGKYKKGLPHGTWNYYDADGKLIATYRYQKGKLKMTNPEE